MTLLAALIVPGFVVLLTVVAIAAALTLTREE